MTEKLEPDEKTIASLNASLEKCWNDAENPLPYIPLVVATHMNPEKPDVPLKNDVQEKQ